MKRKVHMFDCIAIFFLVEMYIVYQLNVSSTIKIMAGIFSAIMIGICFSAGSCYDLKRKTYLQRKKRKDKKVISNFGNQKS